jgi:hypothetical protein
MRRGGRRELGGKLGDELGGASTAWRARAPGDRARARARLARARHAVGQARSVQMK